MAGQPVALNISTTLGKELMWNAARNSLAINVLYYLISAAKLFMKLAAGSKLLEQSLMQPHIKILSSVFLSDPTHSY